jgi:ubiquinone/menaquinone biosynthesis C-methylase UbiE
MINLRRRHKPATQLPGRKQSSQPDHVKQALTEFYNRSAQEYHVINYSTDGRYSPLRYRQMYIERMIEQQRLPRGARILDVGCGPGELLLRLRQDGYDALGVDISQAMVDKASHLLRSRGFADGAERVSVGDIEGLRFPDGSFDAVIAAGVIEYQTEDSRALHEMARVLKPGGCLIVNVSSKSYMVLIVEAYRWMKKQRVTRRLLSFLKKHVLRKGELRDLPDRRTHSPRAFDREIARHGFRIVDYNYFHFSPLPPPLDSVFDGWCRPLGQRMERLTKARRLGRLLGGGYLIAARKEA